MSVIRKDSHGLYVKAGGYLFRPRVNCSNRHLRELGIGAGATAFTEADRPKARHIGQTTRARVVGKDGLIETWFAHGCYAPGEPSDKFWDP